MIELTYNTLVVLAGSAFLGAGAGVVGSFAVLRRRALTGDALAHATLPGICIGFLIAGERNLPAMLCGALFSGVLGVAVITGLRRWTRIKEDAAIGIVLGVFFGAGIVVSRLIQNLATTGSKAGLDSFILGKTAGMTLSDVYLLAGMAAICVVLVILLYKEFKITVFDPDFGKAQGWPVVWLDLLLMSLVAVAVVIGLPAVGVVLMAALLILPAAAARFWTDRFGPLLVLSASFGMATGIVGTLLSVRFENLPAGAIIVLTGSTVFLASMLCAPTRGVLARLLAERRFRRELAAGKVVFEPVKILIDEEPVERLEGASIAAPRKRSSNAAEESPKFALSPVGNLQSPLGLRMAAVGFATAAALLFGWWWRSLDSIERPLAYWTIVVACLATVPCALLGCYLILQRMSLLGDAISHAVLPGIAIAFLLSGQIGGLPVVLGAMGFGVLAAVLTHGLHDIGRVPEDSSMGVVYTTLFAAGVLLITRFAANTHLDADCVLYGMIELVPLDLIRFAGHEIPRSLPTFTLTCAATLLFIFILRKELAISSFDPALATAMGLNATLMHYLLMSFVAAITVTAFEAVGSILVIAMLIVPGATAHLLTDRLGPMLAWSAVVAVISSVFGYVAAHAGGGVGSTNVAGMIAVMAGVQFGLAVFFAPKHGLVGKWWRNFELSLRIAREDIVAMLYRAEEMDLPGASPEIASVESKTSKLAMLMAVPSLRKRGEVQGSGVGMRLTDAGRELARSIIRSHRLWESYLGRETELPLDHLHEPAERMEHFIGRRLQEQIAAILPADSHDPHGREIPSEGSPRNQERAPEE